MRFKVYPRPSGFRVSGSWAKFSPFKFLYKGLTICSHRAWAQIGVSCSIPCATRTVRGIL